MHLVIKNLIAVFGIGTQKERPLTLDEFVEDTASKIARVHRNSFYYAALDCRPAKLPERFMNAATVEQELRRSANMLSEQKSIDPAVALVKACRAARAVYLIPT